MKNLFLFFPLRLCAFASLRYDFGPAAKTRQVGLRLDADDDMGLKRVAQREGRSEQEILRDSLRM